MSILAVSFCFILLHFIRIKLIKNRFHSIKCLVIIYSLCLMRIFLPFEFPWVRIIETNSMSQLSDFIFFKEIVLFGRSIFIHQIIVTIYSIIVILKLGHLFSWYIKAKCYFSKCSQIASERLYNIFNVIKSEHKHNRNVVFCEAEGLKTPINIGLSNNRIVFPKNFIDDLSDTDLYNIISHEYTHILNYDTFYKLVANISSCILFWNPCIWLLSTEMEQALELRCDQEVTKNMNFSEKTNYLSTMLSTICKSKGKNYSMSKAHIVSGTVSLNLITDSVDNIKERFEYIASCRNSHYDKIISSLFSILFIIIMLFSYSFVFQIGYAPSTQDIVTSSDTYEIDFKRDYIVIESNGKSFIQLKNGRRIMANKYDIEHWKANSGRIITK